MNRIFRPLLAAGLALTLLLSPAAALELDDAKQLLDTYYVDRIPDEVFALDSLEELLSALGDPYTAYMSAEEYASFMDSVDGGSVLGVGVSIQTHLDERGGLLILSVLPSSPAMEAGVQAGDRILAIDGQAITTFEDSVKIRGEEGTSVSLTLLRADTGLEESVTLERRAVTIPIVTYDLEDGVPVIRCISFGSSTSDTVGQAVEAYADLERPYLLDLRANPGGTTSASASAAGWFVGGATMVYFRSGSGHYSNLSTVPGFPDLTDQPLIVLTSPYSASGSELFSAAIRDHGAGIAVGQRTFGKGVAQIVLDESNYPNLFDGDCLKITTYRFYSPDGATNDTVGVLPTLSISPENTPAVALLLAEKRPSRAEGYLRLELAGQVLFVSQAAALEQPAAFAELLEALPPSAVLCRGGENDLWTPTAPGDLARALGLEFRPRTFTDTAGTGAALAVDTLAVYGMIQGYDDGTFRPGSAITRAEFCALVASALNLRQSAAPLPFSDLPGDSWYAPYVGAMYAKGLIAGSGSKFRPGDAITYQEMAAVMAQAAQWLSMEGDQYAKQNWDQALTGLYPSYDAWAQPSALVLDFMGVLDKGRDPRQAGTRGDAAQLLYSLLDACHLLWN